MTKVLALDIGGTNSRIALIEFNKNKYKFLDEKIYPTKNINKFEDIFSYFGHNAESACIGFAGPVTGNKAKLTNANLSIDVKRLKKKTGIKKISLINDFHANGYCINYLKKKDTLSLNKGSLKNNVIMVIGPGTGLGKAYVINDIPYPCESGQTTLGIENEDEYKILKHLNKKNKYVYYENVLSGKGISELYEFYSGKKNIDPRIITDLKDKNAKKTLSTFTKFFARFTRDSALSLISCEVYLMGGITTAIPDYLKREFMTEFLKHRNYTHLLKKIKVKAVLNKDAGLIGAGVHARELL